MTAPEVGMVQLARQVAAALGPGWTGEPGGHRWGAYVGHEDGRKLHLHLYHTGRRVIISSVYPGREEGWRFPYHKITVSPDRDPKGIAGDITRRLLPVYEPDLAKATAQVGQWHAEQAGRDNMAARILDLVPGSTSPTHGRSNYQTELWLPGHGMNVKVQGDGSRVTMELHDVPAEAALRILAIAHGLPEPTVQIPGTRVIRQVRPPRVRTRLRLLGRVHP